MQAVVKTKVKSKTALLAVAAVIAVSAVAVGISVFSGGGLFGVVSIPGATYTCAESNETANNVDPATIPYYSSFVTYNGGLDNVKYFDITRKSAATCQKNSYPYSKAMYEDTCLIDVAAVVSGKTTWQSTKVNDCSAADYSATKRNCRLQEGFVKNAGTANPAVGNWTYTCLSGCNSGACVTFMDVSVSPVPVSGTVMAGAQNYTFANLAASAHSDLKITQVKLTIATGNGGFPANLSNSTLWDGTTQLAATNDPDADLSAKTTPGATATAVFTLTSPLTVVKGTTKILTYKANISSAAASGAEFSAGLQPGAEPIVKDLAGKVVSSAISYSAGQKMTVAQAGALTLSSANPLSDTQIVGGQTETVLNFTMQAQNEEIFVEQGYINVLQFGQDIGGIKLVNKLEVYDGTTLVAEGTATTTNQADRTILVSQTGSQSWKVGAGQSKNFALKMISRIPGGGGIASGEAVKFIVDAENLTAMGVASGSPVNKSGAAGSYSFFVFKAILRVALNNQLPDAEKAGGVLPQSGLAGASLYKFKVTAAGGDVGLYEVRFFVSTTTATSVRNWTLWDGGTKVGTTLNFFNQTYIPNNGVGGSGVVRVIFTNNGAVPNSSNEQPIVINEGFTRTFTLKGDIVCVNVGLTCGAAAGSGLVTYSFLAGDSNIWGGQIVASMPDSMERHLLWTDFSVDSNPATAKNAAQWWNSFKVRDMGGSVLPATSTPAVWSR